MVENGSVIVDLNSRELMLVGALLLLWRAQISGTHSNQLGEAINTLVSSELDGSMQQMAIKFHKVVIAGMDGTKNL